MANDLYMTVNPCQACVQNSLKTKQKLELQLFQSSGPLGFITIHDLGLMLKRESDNQYAVIMTNPYSNLKGDIHTAETTKRLNAIMVLDSGDA